MKTIVHIAEYYDKFGGIRTHISDLICELKLQGYQTIIVIPTMEHETGWDNGDPDILWAHVKDKNLKSGIPEIVTELLEYLQEQHVYEIVCHTALGYKIGTFLSATLRVSCVHVLHGGYAFFPEGGCTGCPQYDFNKPCSICTENKILDADKKFEQLYQKKVYLNAAERLIVVNNATKQHLVKNYNISPDKISTIRLWINLPEKESIVNLIKKKKKEVHEGRFIILWAGTDMPLKRAETAYQSFEKVHSIFPMCELWIAGSSQKKHDNNLQLVSEQTKPFIRYLGVLDRNEMDQVYKKVHILWQPSIKETVSYVILEAMSFGIPCIARAGLDNCDFLFEEDNALLFRDEKDIVTLTYALGNDIALYQKIAEGGRKYTEQNHQKEVCLNRYIDILETTGKVCLRDNSIAKSRILMVSTYEEMPRSFLKPQLGQVFIKKYLESKFDDVEVELIDPQIEKIENVHRKLEEYWDILCFYVTYPTLMNSAKLMLYAKQNTAKKGVVIIVGGPGAFYRDIFSIMPADIEIKGEGEKSLASLTALIKTEKMTSPFKKMDKEKLMQAIGCFSIRFQNEEGKSEIINRYNRIEKSLVDKKELNKLVVPAQWEYCLNDRYALYTAMTQKCEYGYPMYFGRGCCSFGCDFCSSYSFFKSGLGTRFPEPEEVVNSLEELFKNRPGIRHVMIEDDNFVPDKKWTIEVLELIRIRKNQYRISPELSLVYKTRVDVLDKELLEYSKKAGVRQINIGIESVSPDILKELGKTTDADLYPKKVTTILATARQIGINIHAYMIFFTPDMKLKDFAENVFFAADLILNDTQISCYEGVLFFPGSPMANRWSGNLDVVTYRKECNPLYNGQLIENNNFVHPIYGSLPYSVIFPEVFLPMDPSIRRIWNKSQLIHKDREKEYMKFFGWNSLTSARTGLIKIMEYLECLREELRTEDENKKVEMYIRKLNNHTMRLL